jgi:hypothetical protein
MQEGREEDEGHRKAEWKPMRRPLPTPRSRQGRLAADPGAAKAKAGELKAVIEKWGTAFKEMAAAPAKPEPKKK